MESMDESVEMATVAADFVLTALKQLDKTRRRDFEHAFEVAPELVLRESRFIDFLRIENFDPHLAAERLAWYWTYRKSLFAERWIIRGMAGQLLPLVQTGLGALNMDDVELLRTGGVVFLPRPAPCCPLCVTDYSRLEKLPKSQGIRLAYYYTALFGDEISRSGGIEMVHFVASDRKISAANFQPKLWEMILFGLPLRIKEMYIVKNVEVGKERLLDYLTFSVSKSWEYNTGLENRCIASSSRHGILKALNERGIANEHIPQKYGGLYNYKQFDDFIRMRISLEDAMSAARLRASVVPTQTYRAVAQVKRAPNESQQDFERRRNAVYSRRVHQRRQNNMVELEQQTKVLELQKKALLEERRRLESLWTQAQSLIATLGPSMDQYHSESADQLLRLCPVQDYHQKTQNSTQHQHWNLSLGLQ